MSTSTKIQKTRKIFLNNMNSWFSNFVIEELRNETATDIKITKNIFSGTMNNSNMKLPRLFEPSKIKIDYNLHYDSEIFKNDVFIYNTEDSDLDELEYLIRGLKLHSNDEEKTLIIVSNIMTWAKTPLKETSTSDKDELEYEEFFNNDVFEDENNSLIKEENNEESLIKTMSDHNKNSSNNNLKKLNSQISKLESKTIKEGVKKRYYLYTDKDYATRVPHPRYQHLVFLENLAINFSNANSMFKVYVVCPGFSYGCGENFFYEFFKLAWYQSPPELPLLEEHSNSVPTIHIIDLAKTIKRIIETKPKENYIIACDKTKDQSLKNLILSISKSIGSGRVRKLKVKDLPLTEGFPNINELTINVKFKTSSIYYDEKSKNEDIYDFKKRMFDWHCENGILENKDKIKNEFKSYRNLKNTRIFITGAPGSGKSTLSECLAKELKLPHLKINDLIEEAKVSRSELGDEVRAKQEEIINKAVEEAEALLKKKAKNAVPVDRNTVHIRFPEDLINKIVKSKLNENICTNLGYVLDGYPRNSHEAKLLFFNEKTLDSNQLEARERMEKERQEKEKADKNLKKKDKEIVIEKIFEDYNYLTINEPIAPQLVVKINNISDDFIKTRLKEFSEAQGIQFNDERLIRRSGIYKAWNDASCNNLYGNSSVLNLFKEYGLNWLILDGNIEEVDFLVKNVIDKIEKSQDNHMEDNFKYQNIDVFDDFKNKESFEKELEKIDKHADNDSHIKDMLYEDILNPLDKQMKQNSKYDEMKEKNRQILEKRSQVLRLYLIENVIPILSEGILKVSHELPENPVEYLQEFLEEKVKLQIKNMEENN